MKDTLVDIGTSQGKVPSATAPWRELSAGKEEMQKIILLLVEFDERTGRFKRYGDPESHWMRKAAATCSPDHLKIYIRDMGSWVYHVVVRVNAAGGDLETSWIHEDGIRAERESLGQEHPVQKIVCLTDIIEKHAFAVENPFELDLSEEMPGVTHPNNA